MSKNKNVHVTHRADKTWAVVRPNADRASSVHRTQGEALEVGRTLAAKGRGELVIHDRDNKIRDKDSFGKDPNPPKDKRH